MSRHKIGDRVRVTVEGEVSYVAGGFTNVKSTALGGTHTIREAHATIEVLTPPVTTFGAGDTVRNKSLKGLVYSLANDGYFAHHHGGQWRPWPSHQADRCVFTSENYEKVGIG